MKVGEVIMDSPMELERIEHLITEAGKIDRSQQTHSNSCQAEAEVTPMAIFYPDSPQEVVIVKLAPFHHFLHNYAMETTMETPVSSCKNNRIHICPDRNLSDLE